MSNNGIYLHFQYLAPRKRKAKTWGCAAFTLNEAIELVKAFKKQNGGVFFLGKATACHLWETDSNGEKITMSSVPIFAPYEPLTDEQMQDINGDMKVYKVEAKYVPA